MLITIEQYAENHGVHPHTVMYHLRTKRLAYTKQYGKRLIDSKAKYPESIAGRPKSKTKRK